MLDNHKIVLDNFCEIDRLLAPFADARFFDLAQHDVVPDAIYIIGRNQFNLYSELIHSWINNRVIRGVVLCNPAEGSETMIWINRRNRIDELFEQNKAAVITGGALPDNIPHLLFEHFAVLIHDYKENLQAIDQYKQNYSTDRPYKFLFLNGRLRTHRRYLLERFQDLGLLDQALWTNLDEVTFHPETLTMTRDGVNLLKEPFPIHYLPPEYEVDRYRTAASQLPVAQDVQGPVGPDLYAKRHLFGNEWGEIYIESRPYEHTYFSVVTETIFGYPYSFRTEKIWKPIAVGHPWIAVSNRGFYRDMHNLGFQTFGHVIDESFDLIDNDQDRINRITQVVNDLCQQDLVKFLQECYTVCKYNQQHHIEMAQQWRQELPVRFQQFINERFNI
jgi:hypothetical protein